MKISRIRITHHRLPLDPPFHAAWDPRPRTRFDATIVRVETDEGLVGIGSGGSMHGFAGHEDLFVGTDPLALDRHFRVIESLSFHYGRCWPLEVALWDLAGKIRGEPCWKLLGGGSGRVRAYASSGSRRRTEEAVELALRVKAMGFPAMKLRFWHPDWREDVAQVHAVREAVEGLDLMVDCNQAWRMPWDESAPWRLDDARSVAEALEGCGLGWIEEPLWRGDWEGLRTLRGATRIPVAGGELTREMHELRELVTRGCLDVVQPDAVLVGGLGGLSGIARLSADHDVVFTPHTWGNGIGLLSNAHLAAGVASPILEFPFDPPEWPLERRDFPLARPVEVDGEGWLVLPDRPGLGVELDEERLRATRI